MTYLICDVEAGRKGKKEKKDKGKKKKKDSSESSESRESSESASEEMFTTEEEITEYSYETSSGGGEDGPTETLEDTSDWFTMTEGSGTNEGFEDSTTSDYGTEATENLEGESVENTAEIWNTPTEDDEFIATTEEEENDTNGQTEDTNESFSDYTLPEKTGSEGSTDEGSSDINTEGSSTWSPEDSFAKK